MNENFLTPDTVMANTKSRQTAEATPVTVAPETHGVAEGTRDEGLDERVRTALFGASEKKALDPVVLDLRAVANFTDYFLIASGTNIRQVQAIADEVVERLKKQGVRPLRIEGYGAAEWVLLDYGDFIFHIFEEKSRRFYNLERLWRDAGRVALPPDLRGDEPAARDGSVRSES